MTLQNPAWQSSPETLPSPPISKPTPKFALSSYTLKATHTRVTACPSCNNPIITGKTDKVYCSARCEWLSNGKGIKVHHKKLDKDDGMNKLVSSIREEDINLIDIVRYSNYHLELP